MVGIFFNKRGYITVFTLITSLALITSVFLSINTGKYFFEQNFTDTATDSIALSLATWESRGLNSIAILNYGMTRSVYYIRVVLMLWASSIGVALAGHPALFYHLCKRAPGVIRKLWASGVKFSEMAKRIKIAVPLLVVGCYRELLKYYRINGLIYPSLPVPANKGDAVLRLYLKDGKPLSIAGIVREAKGEARSHKPKNRFKRILYRLLTRIFFSQVRFIFGLKGEIVPQVKEPYFDEKQVICFYGYSVKRRPFLDTIFDHDYRNFALSCAKPFGGTLYRATWKSKLVAAESKMAKKLRKGGNYDF
jgi:hypothetical protein